MLNLSATVWLICGKTYSLVMSDEYLLAITFIPVLSNSDFCKILPFELFMSESTLSRTFSESLRMGLKFRWLISNDLFLALSIGLVKGLRRCFRYLASSSSNSSTLLMTRFLLFLMEIAFNSKLGIPNQASTFDSKRPVVSI